MKFIKVLDDTTRFPDTTKHHTDLDYFLISCSENYCVDILALQVTSYLSLVSIKADAKPKASNDIPFQRTDFQYINADWDSLKSYIAEHLLSQFLKYRSSRAAALIFTWMLSVMEIL